MWCASRNETIAWASAESFPVGRHADILLVIVKLLTMQCKLKFTKRFTLCSPQRNYPVLRQQSQNMRLVGNNRNVNYNKFAVKRQASWKLFPSFFEQWEANLHTDTSIWQLTEVRIKSRFGDSSVVMVMVYCFIWLSQ